MVSTTENKMLKIEDLHGRVHDYLRISITENCNLRCTYCMPAEGINLTPKAHLMTADEIESIAKTFVSLGVKKIRLTGGEPLVRKDARDIIERLGKLNTELTITTNGLLVHEYIDTFKAAGIKTLNISLDTLQKDKYKEITRRDNFDALWRNIELLILHEFIVKINVVLIKGFNDSEILDFINLTKEMDVQIRFIEFMPFNGNQWDKSKLISYAEILEKLNAAFDSKNILRTEDKPNDTARNHKIKAFKGSFSVISSVTNPFCGTCNRIRLTADGKLKNCLFSNTETALLDALRKGESLLPLIEKNIKSKFPVRGGMEKDVEFQNPKLYSKNRSMIKIGG
jgi:molybdenum cofactor biosynthesis protein A